MSLIFKVTFNEALDKVVEEKEKIIQDMRQREKTLLEEKEKDRGKTLRHVCIVVYNV